MCFQGFFGAKAISRISWSHIRRLHETMCCLMTPRAQIVIVTSALGRCLLDKRAVGPKSGKFSVNKCFSSHFPLQKPPGWHYEARMVGRGELLKETRGERWFDGDWTAKTIHVETQQFTSEVISLAVLWMDSKTYQGNMVEFWLLKNAISVIFCR